MRLCLTTVPLLLGSALTLAACSSPFAPAPTTEGRRTPPAAAGSLPVLTTGQAPRNQCNAQAAQMLLGQPWSSDTLARALTATGADEARMLRPDTIITKEYKMGRVNVVIGPDNRVQRVHCG